MSLKKSRYKICFNFFFKNFNVFELDRSGETRLKIVFKKIIY